MEMPSSSMLKIEGLGSQIFEKSVEARNSKSPHLREKDLNTYS
jgi:hypothetical protein